jgi:DNA repair protein RecN (Recombination protein N)
MALLELAVSDLALIERVRVPLRDGLTVITGETGAGKSLLIDALTLVLGGRADPGLVRAGATTARVEALFDRPGAVPDDDAVGSGSAADGSGSAADGSGSAGVAEVESEALICAREIGAHGRTVARIDDQTVTVARLASMAGPLVEIHGQLDQGRLLSTAEQRDLLDAAGGSGPLRDAVATAVAAWRANRAALRELELPPAELERRLELAQHGADEIAASAIRPGEVAELEARRAVAAASDRITRLLGAALERLDQEGRGARDLVALAVRDLGEAARLDPRLSAIAEAGAGLEAEAADLALELRRAVETGGASETDLAALEERLGALFGLLRKYGGTEEAVLEEGERMAAEVERLHGLDAERERRAAADAHLLAAAQEAAGRLREARHATATGLARAVTASLRELGFPSAAFDIAVEPAELDATGADEVAFILAPNPGEPARPLSRIASGGELSRVALAVKGVLAAADRTPTLVFDEVDAGIGGRSADPVGLHLWRLARSHQVLCVTHLPQIAAHADTHLRIAKRERDGRTVTEVRELVAEDRVDELAAMLGGAEGAPAAAATARELLERAHAAHAAPAAPAAHAAHAAEHAPAPAPR